MIVLLRKLTRKSVIGFSAYVDLTVQNLLDQYKHKELLELYYFFRNIDFADDVLEELHITGERRLDKKNSLPDEDRFKYKYLVGQCLYSLIEARTEQQNNKINKQRMGINQREGKQRKNNISSIVRHISRKGVLQYKNQHS
jgi:hypothetical protein